MRDSATAPDQELDVSLLAAAGGAEVVDRFLNTASEMNRPNWAANLALQVYRAMRSAELCVLRSHEQTTGSARAAGMPARDRVP